MKKLHNQDYAYKHEEKIMSNVNLEVAQKVIAKLSKEKPFRVLTKDNGRIMVAFLNKQTHEEFSAIVEEKNQYGDSWIQHGEEKVFECVDNESRHTIVIAEFWTDEKFDYEESLYIDGLVKFHFDIKEDTGVYKHPFDVYSPSELL